MKTFLRTFLPALFMLAGISAHSQEKQTATADTSQYPYWIQMMQDPDANFFQTQRAFELYWKDRPITKGCGWKPFKRWESYMQTRVSPTGEKPSPDAVFNAYNSYMQQHDQSASLNGNWISQGPVTIPMAKGYQGLGRINAIAFHPTDPNTIYIGAPSGGLWVSTQGGNSWTTSTDILPTLGVSSIAINPADPQIMYIGTGDRDAGDAPGIGVMKSTDGGVTWNLSNSGMGTLTVGKMLIDEETPDVIYAATSGGIYKSVDGGSNWTKKISGNFKDLVFKPGDQSILYAAADARFYRSTDHGENWLQITSGIPGASRGVIGVSPANPNIVYFLLAKSDNGYQGIYRSTDGGLNFTERSTTPNIMDWSCDGSGSGGQAWYDLCIAVDPLNADIIYTGGVDIWKSTNGGTNWQISGHWYGGCGVPAVHADQHVFEVNPLNNRIYVGNDGGIYYTENGGTNWPEISNGLVISQTYKLGQSATVDDRVVNGYQDNGSSLFDNGQWYAIGGGDGMECAIDYTNHMVSYTTVYYGSIDRHYGTGNQGSIAGNGTNGIDEEGAWVTPFILDAKDPNTMFIGYKNVWRSRNVKNQSVSGVKWTKISTINTGNLSVLEQSPVNTDILYASSGSSLYLSANAQSDAPTWTNITSFLPSGSEITDLEAHPFEENTVYMTMADNKVYKSTDRAASWTEISGSLPNIHISNIEYYKNSQEGLYLGTDAGVFYKDLSMTDWIPFNNGMPANARVTEIEIFYDSVNIANDRVKASTYGRGLWKSDMYFTTPTADFSANKTLVPPGCPVNFKDLSLGVPSQWDWSFVGGNPSTSTDKNPQNIVFNNPGTYTIELTATNAAGSGTMTKTAYIIVSDTLKPIANFSADNRVFCTTGETVAFTDESEYCPIMWQWEFTPNTVTFVNGTGVNSQNPSVLFSQEGNYNVQLVVTNTNGIDAIVKQDYILVGGYQLPFSEDFESMNFSTRSWDIENPDMGITWDIDTIYANGPSQYAARMDFFHYATPPGRRDRMISPALDFSGMEHPLLSFDHAYASRYSSTSDSLVIYISGDCGTSWTRVFQAGEKGQGTFATTPKTTTLYVPTIVDDWCGIGWGSNCYSIDLSAWANLSGVKIAFESYNRFGNNLYIDNISVTEAVGVVQPATSGGIAVYPNPTKGFVTITSDNPIGTTTISVVDMAGVTRFRKVVDNAHALHETLDLNNLSPGLYFVKISSQETNVMRKLVIN
ncbi:MAG TPA: PKD domain-containing protein [Bacteroidales bacterium]|jgi:PKD repeat protein/photosystem II stability/assembly factor-like uncharacterized protein|nr:PKD domain-containing protein [Bacteroidales bacterium]